MGFISAKDLHFRITGNPVNLIRNHSQLPHCDAFGTQTDAKNIESCWLRGIRGWYGQYSHGPRNNDLATGRRK
jgi:hypothetical protein